MKKPKYIWLSIIAYVYLFASLSAKIRFQVKPFDMDLWLSFLKHSLGKFIAIVILPIGILLVCYAAIDSTHYGDVLLLIIWIYFYFAAVSTSSKLYGWGKNHNMI